jgi:hypothetical protein
MWIAIIWSVCFPNGTWANPIHFPNPTFLPLFVFSAAASSVACMIIGFEYLGVGNEFRRKARTTEKPLSINVHLQTNLDGSENRSSLAGDYRVLFNLDDPADDLSLLVLARNKTEPVVVCPTENAEQIVCSATSKD